MRPGSRTSRQRRFPLARTLTVTPPQRFAHAGHLNARQSDHDPRAPEFGFDSVTVDLRRCQDIGPAGMLWCLIFLLLVRLRTIDSELLVPENLGVRLYLQSVGIFDLLQESGVAVDDRDVSPGGQVEVIAPLTRFDSLLGAESLGAAVESNMQGSISANLVGVTSDAFVELASNAVQHSRTPVGSYGLVQRYDNHVHGPRILCAVADGGVGIRESLESNPEYKDRFRYDWSALEYATRERVSGTADAYRGIGLFGIAEDAMSTLGRQLILHSGRGSLFLADERRARTTSLFPGTSAVAVFPS